jgi:type I restriction enzyme S subunit
MGKLEKYTSYKDSGVEWLGEIPEHWEVKKLKLISNVYNGATPSSGIEKFWNGHISWVTPTDFNKSNYIGQTERKITKSGLHSCGTTLVPKDSIIMTTRAPIGNIAIAENELCTNQGCKSIVIDKNTDKNFMFYQFYTKSELLNSLGSGTTFMELSSKELKNIKLPLPPKEEQTKIASFLDEKTAQIDKAISQKEKLIELLKERRQITINEAVTKGLDKAVEFKDSGVEWIGEIPKHWNLLANKHIFKLKKDTVGKNSSEYSLLSLTLQGIIKRDLDGGGKFPAEFDTYQEVKQGDFVFCLFDVEETPRTVGLSEYDGMITGAYTVMSVQDMDRKYLYYFYLNLDSKKRLKPLYRGLRNTIPKDSFFAFKTFVPPKNEQIKIVEYIETQTTKIDKAIELQQNYIAKLKEYKASLIDSVVTGKVRVV